MSFLKKTVFSVAEYFTPVLTTSQFYKTGQLTPEELVITGDQLVSKCASWRWGTGSEETIRSYLPRDKQYLYTKGVVSLNRVSNVSGALLDETETGEDDWLLTTRRHQDTDEDDGKTTTDQSPDENTDGGVKASDNTNDDDDCPDLDDFDYEDLEDTDVAPTTSEASTDQPEASKPATVTTKEETKKSSSVPDVRTYDISIVYDKLYRCPRVYLHGYSSSGKVLSEQEIQEDISADHMNKTVTWEVHPYTGLPCLSIHPCQHAHTMKRMLEIMVHEEAEIIRQEQERLSNKEKEGADEKQVLGALSGKDGDDDTPSPPASTPRLTSESQIIEEAWKRVQNRMTVDKSIFLFLKFIATVIPTIDYDHTTSMDLF